MTNKVFAFKSKFDKVIKICLPSFWDGNGDVMNLVDYKGHLKGAKEDCADIDKLTSSIKGEIVYKTLYNDFDIIFGLKHIVYELSAPTYVDHVELEMKKRNTRDHKYPLGKEWGEMMILIKKAFPQATHSETSCSQDTSVPQ